MGIPHMAHTGNGLVDMTQRMATLGDHLLDTIDIDLVVRVGD
jgi:hypothetical protein